MLSVALLVRWRCQQQSKNRGLFALRRVASKVEAPKNASGCQQGGVNTSPNAEVFLLSVVLPARCQTQVAKKGQRSNGGLLALCPVASKVSTQVKMPRTFCSLSSCQQGVNSSKNRGLFALLSRVASKVSTRAQNRGPLAPLRRFASKVSGFGRIRHLASKSSTHFFPRKTVPVSICQ